MLRPEEREATPAVGRLDGAIALRLQRFRECLPQGRLVLDDQDSLGHVSESTEIC
jgi:hypothetical protein